MANKSGRGIQVVYIVRYLYVRCNVLESIFTKIKVSMFYHLSFKHDTKTNHVFLIFRFFFKKKNEGFTIKKKIHSAKANEVQLIKLFML